MSPVFYPMKLTTFILLQAGILPAERNDFALYVSKNVPQRLKPSSAQGIYGTAAEAVPFVRHSSPLLRSVIASWPIELSNLDKS
jgi:hypothetical protein